MTTASRHSVSSGKRTQRGFSPADLLNLWQPSGAWEEHRGLAYGDGPRQKLDVYRPRHAAKAPVVVFFHGGSWQGGSRNLYSFVGASLAAQGVVTVVPDYSIFRPRVFRVSSRTRRERCALLARAPHNGAAIPRGWC